MSPLHKRIHQVCLAIIVVCIIVLTLIGCASAKARQSPKLETPGLPAPTVPGPSPKTKRISASPNPVADPNDSLAPTDFTLGDEIAPPQGCIDLRKRTHNPTAC